MNSELGIYIDIPFCARKCFYCDFSSYSGKEKLIESYTHKLCNEILQNMEVLSSREVTTIYIGGGTPSYIDAKYIKQILDTLYLIIDINKIKEATIEVNPNSLTKEKMQIYKECGINRVSIGLQSTYDNILKNIGRLHTYKDFLNALNIVNECGIDNISLDLIYPLPGLTLEMLKNTLSDVVKLKDKNVKHISIYNLEIHENTKLAFLLNEGYLSIANEDEEYEMYKYLSTYLEQNGFKRYEISNYAIPGYESKHNLKYWNQEEYLGFGVSASSFINGERYTNNATIESYLSNMVPIESEEFLDKDALMNEYVILNLRKIDGMSLKEFNNKFKIDFLEKYKGKVDMLVNEKLLVLQKGNLKLTDRGLEVANIVWEEFI